MSSIQISTAPSEEPRKRKAAGPPLLWRPHIQVDVSGPQIPSRKQCILLLPAFSHFYLVPTKRCWHQQRDQRHLWHCLFWMEVSRAKGVEGYSWVSVAEEWPFLDHFRVQPDNDWSEHIKIKRWEWCGWDNEWRQFELLTGRGVGVVGRGGGCGLPSYDLW